MRSGKGYQVPPFSFLNDPDEPPISSDDKNLRMQSQLLEKKLEDFGVHGKVVAVSPGPVITTYEYEPAAGVKINKIVNLSDDLSLALRATSIRIVAPIPGKPSSASRCRMSTVRKCTSKKSWLPACSKNPNRN
jgi:S-DNA-T family DNA segregation ATPase FtsK/SpoIIIE